MEDPKKPPNIADPYPCRAVRGPDAAGLWYWRAEVTLPGGKRKTLWTGWATRAGAVDALSALRVAPEEPPPGPAGPIRTVGDLLRVWYGTAIKERPDLSRCTIDTYRHATRRLRDAIGAAELPLGRVALDAWQDARIRDGAARATLAGEIQTLRVAWAWAVDAELFAFRLPNIKNRCRKVKTKPTPDPGEVARLLAWIVSETQVDWPGRLLRLLAATGARIGEVADLRWGAIDLPRRLISVTGKTGPRTVPITDSIAAEIRSWGAGAPDDRVWGVTPARARSGIQTYLAQASAELGLPPASPHALRRAVCDALYEAGGDVSAIAKVLGQSPQTAMRHYRQPRERSLRAVVEAADLGALPLAHSPRAQRKKVGVKR